ncbi:G-protein coupled receptor 157-like [Dysidea avara]|uniref:G-protein coupled receptor 157-like n=1 Tax=Dysidea avara TaxID=196820 RepID=UPI00332FA7B0
MDVMYSTANLVGLALPYRRHLVGPDVVKNSAVHHTYYRICQAQAAFAVYGTIGSVLWTLGLAVYLYYRIVSRDADVAKWVVRLLYVVCYTLPLYTTLWLLCNDQLGYSDSPLSGGGWCSMKDNIDPLANFMTYDIWMWMGVILVPLYVSIHVHIRDECDIKEGSKIRQCNNSNDHQFLIISNPALGRTELKLLFVPTVFIILRAIGDCSQGMFNFIIFFIFQPKLRALLKRCMCYYCIGCNTNKYRHLPVDDDDDDELDDSTSLQSRSRTSSQFKQYTT